MNGRDARAGVVEIVFVIPPPAAVDSPSLMTAPMRAAGRTRSRQNSGQSGKTMSTRSSTRFRIPRSELPVRFDIREVSP